MFGYILFVLIGAILGGPVGALVGFGLAMVVARA